MKVGLNGPLTIDGIALGQTRDEVGALLGRAITNSNPAWARYYGNPKDCPGCSPTSLPVLVGYQAHWSGRTTDVWQVQSLFGATLAQNSNVLIRVGDLAEEVRITLGSPDEEFQAEPGIACLAYGGLGCLVSIDEHSDRVIEIALRAASEAAVESNAACERLFCDEALAS